MWLRCGLCFWFVGSLWWILNFESETQFLVNMRLNSSLKEKNSTKEMLEQLSSKQWTDKLVTVFFLLRWLNMFQQIELLSFLQSDTKTSFLLPFACVPNRWLSKDFKIIPMNHVFYSGIFKPIKIHSRSKPCTTSTMSCSCSLKANVAYRKVKNWS